MWQSNKIGNIYNLFDVQGALLLTEVLKEREAQLELKRLKEAASEGQDLEWVEQAQREYEEGILRDQQDAAKRIEKAHRNASFQKAQSVSPSNTFLKDNYYCR